MRRDILLRHNAEQGAAEVKTCRIPA